MKTNRLKYNSIASLLLILFITSSLHAKETITVWAMGEEGKKIAILAREFEKENPGIKVITQAIPWDAAHDDHTRETLTQLRGLSISQGNDASSYEGMFGLRGCGNQQQ